MNGIGSASCPMAGLCVNVIQYSRYAVTALLSLVEAVVTYMFT
jgi:hypothetical protein